MHGRRTEPNSFQKAHVHVMSPSLMPGQGMQSRDKRSPVGSPSQSDMAGLRADDQDFVFSSPSVPLSLQGSSWRLLI